MSQLHIDEFYHDAGCILASLYDVFPRKNTVYVEDISGDDEPDEFGLHSPRHLACLAAMTWLADQHYIRYDQLIRHEAMEAATLTEKAFLVLTSPSQLADEEAPEDISGLPPLARQNFTTNIAILKMALKSRDSAKINRIMQRIMVESANYPTKVQPAV
ncbi:Uncharacterised protein [BD1-7 clade bacterium]|uniref:Uncharacterized protein n=1 Tax=BD1-7 clade bacterium TaxID=2029982 RepID=A0A5S9Q4X2_9GAMM|nr:Uncharacterised protein [BD1-7 clade bacterium]CAA0111960.1 Uncharacterised protein [BD1-7 clade bacterium]